MRYSPLLLIAFLTVAVPVHASADVSPVPSLRASGDGIGRMPGITVLAPNVFVASGTRTYLILQNASAVEQEIEYEFTPHNGTGAHSEVVLRFCVVAAGQTRVIELNGDPDARRLGSFSLWVGFENVGAASVVMHPLGPDGAIVLTAPTYFPTSTVAQ
jgi:hypothetical protein